MILFGDGIFAEVKWGSYWGKVVCCVTDTLIRCEGIKTKKTEGRYRERPTRQLQTHSVKMGRDWRT